MMPLPRRAVTIYPGIMRTALITIAIVLAGLGAVVVFDRRSTTSSHPAQSLEAELLQKVEARRQAAEKVQDVADNASPSLEELVALMSDRDPYVRKESIREIAKTGRADMIPVIKRAFADKDKDVPRAALLGIGDSFDEDPFRESKTAAAFKEDLFPLVAAAVSRDLEVGKASFAEETDHARRTAIQLLPRMDLTRAAELLQQPDLLRVTNPDFDEILAALSDAGIPVKIELNGLLEEFRAKARAGDHRARHIYGELLRAAATLKHSKIGEMIEEALGFTNDWTTPEKAAEAQWIVLGLSPTLDDDILIQAEKIGAGKLELPLQHYSVVTDYYYDASNGGCSQYFLNPGSENVRINLAALKAMGADADAYHIDHAMRLFGPDGPPTEQPRRQEMMYAHNNRLFDLIDKMEVPGHITQKYETIVYAKLYLARHVEACKKLPRSYP